MSAFLGPIHFRLYDKIAKQENLTEVIASYAVNNAWISDKNAYIRNLPQLENVIDESNIHGWLQEQINDAEARYARLIHAVTEKHNDRMDKIIRIAFDFGKANRVSAASASDVYRMFEDFFVNGMPCDRVNAVVSESEDELSWKMTKDIHAQHWNGDATAYYAIRKAVMDGMLDESPYLLTSANDACYTIRKR